jgi:hypothetical protein
MRFISIDSQIKIRRTAMTINKMTDLVNKDDTLLVLLGGMLLDGIILIGLIIYVGLKLVS